MTEEERKAEHTKYMASAVYRQMEQAIAAENFVRTVCKRHGDEQAFRDFMRGMLLEGRLARFLDREPVK